MADLRVHHLETRGSQPAGQPFPVTVALNNLETVAITFQDQTCVENGEPGHKALVTLTVRGPDGAEAYSETKRTCIPRNRVGQMGGPNKRVTFEPEISATGTHTVTATVEAVNAAGYDSSDPETVEITGTDSIDDADNGGGGGIDWTPPGGTNDGGDSPLGLPSGGDIDVLVGIVVLALVAWLASSASNTVEAFA